MAVTTINKTATLNIYTNRIGNPKRNCVLLNAEIIGKFKRMAERIVINNNL